MPFCSRSLIGSASRFFLLAILVSAFAHAADLQPADASPSVRVLSADSRAMRLEFELPMLDFSPVTLGGATYQALEIPGGAMIGEPGEPQLPSWSRLLAIPARAAVSVTVTNVEADTLSGVLPLPIGPDDGSLPAADPTAYARAGFNDAPWVVVGAPALARDLRVVPISFQPVRCDPAGRRVVIARRIELAVDLNGTDLRNAAPARALPPTDSFDRLYRELVLNYTADLADDDPGAPSDPPAPGDRHGAALGTCIYICQDSPDVLAALAPLVQWRARKGFSVYVATTAETGATRESIKSWIQNAYDTWENPPEYITLIGDVGGPIAMPCWYENWSGYNGEGDNTYVLLAGSDGLPDAHIGRISVGSLDQLRLYVTKIVGYESTPYMADTEWYTRACVVGDASLSGFTCVQAMQWIKEQALENGYTEVDTVFSSPFVTQMRAKLNRGDTVFSYRGFAGMSGFEVGDILALQNGWKMPYAVNLTCLTGDFAASTSRSEAWIRAGVPPSVPTGGIASVGTATGGTHTRYNNCITYGIWYGVFVQGLFHFGPSLTSGKYKLFADYGVQDYVHAQIFSHWNNLMGDAAGELWTGVPQPLTVTHPESIALGANAVTISVADGGEPCEGACVCLYRAGEMQTSGYTDANGFIELALPALGPGEIELTVSKHDYRPYLASIGIGQQDRFVGWAAQAIDDDNEGTSSGNADGLANPGETIELAVLARNSGVSDAPGVTGFISCADPYATILDDSETFGNLAPGDSAWCADDFDFVIAGGAPDEHVIHFALDLCSGADTWRSVIEIPVVAAAFSVEAVTPYGFGGGIDPADSGELAVRLRNHGSASGVDVRGTLHSQSQWVTITDAGGTFGTIPIDGTGENNADRFGLTISPECYPGHIAPLLLVLEHSGAVRDTVSFVISIGTAASDDPTGPDRYGYYAFDNTDVGYPEAQGYVWVEIDPRYGGHGASVGLNDFGNAQDDSRTVALPFPFTYYGITYNDVTICSNGWIAMGSTNLSNYNNWNIPGGGAPPDMIAPMWDDLCQSGGDQVYHWYDAAGGRYIVQWSRVRNMVGGVGENFEVILYDVSQHPTPTGDGAIVFQYDTFNNTDNELAYSTIGIENLSGDDGVMYGYYNYYNAGAAPIASGRAIRFVAQGVASGLLNGAVRNASNGGTPVGGAEILLLEAGLRFTSGDDGSYGGSVPAGVHTLVASHPSFAADTIPGVMIDPGGASTQDFALTDIAGPNFSHTTQLPSTTDTSGPYAVGTRITDYSAIVEAKLHYHPLGGDWQETPFVPVSSDSSVAFIPGQPLGTLVLYYLEGRDVAGNVGRDPLTAPDETYWFWVQTPQFADDMESGVGTWTHEAGTSGYLDQWHRSSRRNHTPGGSWSWKCGGTGSEGYARLVDGALVTEPLELNGEATLRFWHWMDSELFWYGNEFAFDGGRLEISIDGGQWTPIVPVGDYPYRLMQWDGGSPFPQGSWLYSGQHDWEPAEFHLTEMSGTARIRFRFGTDNFEYASHEGWYIDDVEILLPGPGPQDARELTLHPQEVTLESIAPNPLGATSAGTRIAFDLPRAAPVALAIIDVGGRRVRTLALDTLAAGMHRVEWDGRLADGLRAPSGMYYCVLEALGVRRTQPIVIVR